MMLSYEDMQDVIIEDHLVHHKKPSHPLFGFISGVDDKARQIKNISQVKSPVSNQVWIQVYRGGIIKFLEKTRCEQKEQKETLLKKIS